MSANTARFAFATTLASMLVLTGVLAGCTGSGNTSNGPEPEIRRGSY